MKKSKTKKAVSKQIKRPGSKKIRPKKLIETKMPSLPVLDKEGVAIPKEKEVCRPNIVPIEIPKEYTTDKFVYLMSVAADELKDVAEKAQDLKKLHDEHHSVVMYKDGGMGVVRRANDKAERAIDSEYDILKYKWRNNVIADKLQSIDDQIETIKHATRDVGIGTKVSNFPITPPEKKIKTGLLKRIMAWFNK